MELIIPVLTIKAGNGNSIREVVCKTMDTIVNNNCLRQVPAQSVQVLH